jgi:hypothetical protein
LTWTGQNTSPFSCGCWAIFEFEVQFLKDCSPNHTGSPFTYRTTSIIFTGVHFANNIDKPICSVVPPWSCPIAKETFYDTLTQTRYRFREIQTFACPDQLPEGVITGNEWHSSSLRAHELCVSKLYSRTNTVPQLACEFKKNTLPTAIYMARKNQDLWHDFWLPPRILTPWR